MTTPAKNFDITTNRTGEHCFQQLRPSVGSRICSSTSGFSRRVAESRPASGNASMVSGIRLCRGWNHYGLDISQNSDSASYTAHYPSGVVIRRDIVGNFWLCDIPTMPVDPSSNMINAATVKALNKVKSQDLHLGNFLAEGRQTVTMVGRTLHSIARSVFSYRRRNPSDWELVKLWERGQGLPRYLWCKIPNSWLELQYGWIPLMSDVYGGLQHLQKRSRFENPLVFGRSTQSDETETSTGFQSSVGDGAAWKGTMTWEHKRKVSVSLMYKTANPHLAELSSLGLINPVEIVWELIPYSFVIDWFVPVSDWLSALTADVGMTFVSGSVSRKSEMRFKEAAITVSPALPGMWAEGSPSPPSCGGLARNFVRTCLTSSPVPGLYVKSPISLKHVLNGLALLIQALR